MREGDAAAEILAWYDRHARVMPWRVGPAARAAGARPDPYGVWLSEVMLQQTTVAAVRPYWERFTARWPTVRDLAAAGDGEVMGAWAGLGYYARARNLLACARAVVAEHGGVFPARRDALLELPGVGPYTAAAVAAICHDEPVAVVDGNVERVMARMHAVEAPLPGARRTLAVLAAAQTPPARAGDYAQAVMDLGATVCTPRRPACAVCPWMARCVGRREGIAAELPRRAPKAVKPARRGVLWVATDGAGAWLLERRPARGLLGGTLGWPTTTWADAPEGAPPLAADWRDAGALRHVFTHFRLDAEVRAAVAAGGPERGDWIPAERFDPAALPTLMRRAHALADATLRHGAGGRAHVLREPGRREDGP